MDRIWRYFTLLVLIEMTFFIYFYVIVFKHSTTIFNEEDIKVKERGQDFVDEITRAYTFQPHSKIDRHKKTEKTPYMTNRTVNSNTTFMPVNKEQQYKSNSLPFSNVTEKMQIDGFKNVVKSENNKEWGIRAGKNLRSYKTSYMSKILDKSCIFYFDNDSLLKAREQISSSYYLFNVHLEINGLHGLSNENLDKLLHWQYVLKKEMFLIQLPVDVDLLTYTLLELVRDETTISIKLIYNDSNCLKNNFPGAMRSVQILLWNELFLNDTNYYLCNRYYESAYFLNILYYLTTIWVGFDFSCSEMSSRNGLHVVQDIHIEKGKTPVITSIFCYTLSLQFVWIFVLLDIRKLAKSKEIAKKVEDNSPVYVPSVTGETYEKSTINETGSKSSETNANETSGHNRKQESRLKAPKSDPVQIVCCPVFSESKNKLYTRDDRPYGLKRFILKTLYGKCSFRCCCCKCYRKKCCFHNPTMRLLFLLWVFILLPFGIYRTYWRYDILKTTYEYYLTVARPSEPFFHLMHQKLSISEESVLVLDILYATVFPLFYVFVGHATYEVFLSNDMRLCYCVSEDEDPLLITNNERIDNRFTFRYFQFCRSLRELCCQNDRLDKSGCECTCKYKECFACVFSCIYCAFPCIPFSCFTHKYIIIKDCECCMAENKEEQGYINNRGSNGSKDQLKHQNHRNSVSNENEEENKGGIDREKCCNKYGESKYDRMDHVSGSNTNKEPKKDEKDRESGRNGNREPHKDGENCESGSDTNKEQKRVQRIVKAEVMETRSHVQTWSKKKGAKDNESGSNGNREPHKDGENRESGSDTNKVQNKGANDRERGRNENEEAHKDGNERVSGSNESEEQNKGAEDRETGRNENEETHKDGNERESGSNENEEQNKGAEDRESGRNENEETHKDGNERESGSTENEEQNKGAENRESNRNETEETQNDGNERESGSNENEEQNKGAEDRESNRNENEETQNDGNERESGSTENEEQNKGAEDRESNKNENEEPQNDGNERESDSNEIEEQNNGGKFRESGRNENKEPGKDGNEHKDNNVCKCCCRLSKRKRKCCICVLNALCLFFVLSYFICLRPIFSTFTFLLRSFTYIVFVVFPTRTYIMRVFVMIVTPIVYILNYIHEIINMNTEILNYILKLEEEKKYEILNNEQFKTEHKQESKLEQISEEDFDGVYEKLMFVKKGFYLLYLKVVIVIMYIFITFTTFILNTKSLTGSDFKDILQFLLIIIGPYAIVFFLKANKNDFLTEENKRQIQEAYTTYKREKKM